MGCRYEYCIELRHKQGTVFELINNQWLVIVEIPNLLQMEFIMISKKVKIFVTWLITLSLSIFLSACQKKENSTNTTPTAPTALPDVQSNAGGTSGGGGIDGSGGDVERSSKQQVQAAIKNNLKMLQQALSVMANGLESLGDEAIYDQKFGSGAYNLVYNFIYPTGTKKVNFNLAEDATDDDKAIISGLNPIADALRAGFIVINIQSEPCRVQTSVEGKAYEEEKHDGMAIGDYKHGKICLSEDLLQTLSASSVENDILFLLIHELSHLSGFNEANARKLQNLVAHNKELYSSNALDIFLASNTQKCDYKLLATEIELIKKSQYWQTQLNRILTTLSGSQPRGCGEMTNELEDRSKIFVDDVEFMSQTIKFSDHFDWPSLQIKSEKPEVILSYHDIQGLSDVATLDIRTSTARIFPVEALLGRSAQCSYRGLIANFIANMDDALQIGCGTRAQQMGSLEKIKQRMLLEKKILEEDPEFNK